MRCLGDVLDNCKELVRRDKVSEPSIIISSKVHRDRQRGQTGLSLRRRRRRPYQRNLKICFKGLRWVYNSEVFVMARWRVPPWSAFQELIVVSAITPYRQAHCKARQSSLAWTALLKTLGVMALEVLSPQKRR